MKNGSYALRAICRRLRRKKETRENWNAKIKNEKLKTEAELILFFYSQ